MHVYIRVYTCVYTCVCMCIYVYIHARGHYYTHTTHPHTTSLLLYYRKSKHVKHHSVCVCVCVCVYTCVYMLGTFGSLSPPHNTTTVPLYYLTTLLHKYFTTGMKENDRICSVDSVPVDTLPLAEITQKICGSPGE